MSGVLKAPDKNTSVTLFMADKFGMEAVAFEETLRATVIKPDKNGKVATKAEFAAFLLVCKTYDLNPLTKEIFAFTDKGAVVPIVSVDGWAKLINSHPQCDGITFDDQFDEKGNLISITCNIFRKDRKHPVAVTEYMAECKRGTDTWAKWPRRMLRHKALIQCARYAFGFAGIYDEDEGERIVEANARREPPSPPEPPIPPEPTATKAIEPPVPPIPPEPPVPPEPGVDVEALLRRYTDLVDTATSDAELDQIWNELVEPANLTSEQRKRFAAIDDQGRARF